MENKTEKELRMLHNLNTAPLRKPSVLFNFNDNPELFHQIDTYRRSLGWSWKRVMLVGFANTIARQGDNPDLVTGIADYLMKRR